MLIGYPNVALVLVVPTYLPWLNSSTRFGFGFIEMDVRESKDGEILVIHDAQLERTTNGHGEIRQWNLKELKSLDAGYRFTLDDGMST